MKPKLLVFASGTKTGGGSGFENLVVQSRLSAGAAAKAGENPELHYEVVGVVSNHEHGGVRQRADKLNVPFIHFNPTDYSNILKNIGIAYQEVVEKTGAEWVALSGWLKLVADLDPARTFNIHPGPLPRFGGKGMYGIHVHEAVLEAFKRGEIDHTEVSMHFVTPVYDEGLVFFRHPVEIRPDDTPETLQARVNAVEHEWQPTITNLVVNKKIFWDGRNPQSLEVPNDYTFL